MWVEVLCWIDLHVLPKSERIVYVHLYTHFTCLFVFLYIRSYLLIYEFESWITGVCSPHVVFLCDFTYYVLV